MPTRGKVPAVLVNGAHAAGRMIVGHKERDAHLCRAAS
jgi:hypothetical protein